MEHSNTDKEAAMAGAPPRSEEGYGPEQLVTGVCEKIGLKLDLFGNTAESSDDSPALEGSHVTPKDLKDIITNPEQKAKIKPVLLSFSGLPDSGKSKAVECLRKKYVDRSNFRRIKNISEPKAEGIEFYEIVAASLSAVRNLIINEFTTESCFAPVILSAFKKMLLFDDPGKALLSDIFEFGQTDLDEHLCFTYQYLSQKNFMVGDSQQLDDEEKKRANLLLKSLPEGIAIVNVWDVTISESVRHFLATLQGHLYNHHMWLFLDLKRDLDGLDKPPEIGDDSTVLMKWRPRLQYLLRSCKISEDSEKKRKRVCTIFATHKAQSMSELNEKAKMLKDKVRPAAKHIGVSSLLEKKIETINLDVHDDSQRLYQKFQRIISETPFEDIPIAWIFLRSLFYRFDWIFIARHDLKIMADKCKMDDESLRGFCKFYMSFGSIFDLSLINPKYQFVIVKPISFLKKLGTLLNPSEELHKKYPTVEFGIFPEAACLEIFDGHLFAYMDALVSLSLATRVTRHNLELPDEQLDDNDFYYVPLTRAKALITTPDPKSIHVITSINTPHIFKQAAFTKYFLQLLPQFKLVPSEMRNQTIMKDPRTDGTTVTLVSHSPAIRLRLSKPDEHVCSCIVQAYEKIAENARSQGAIVEYKYVKICAESSFSDAKSTIPSSQYHILPDDKLCTKCDETSTEEDTKLLKAWNKALTKHSIKDCFQSTYGVLKPSEIGEIAEKIASLPLSNVKAIADAFEYSGDKNSLKEHDDIAITEILFSWYKRNKNIQEPRRVFARKISKLGDQVSESCKSKDKQKEANEQEEENEQEEVKKQEEAKKQEEVKAAFIEMAKDVDIYFDSEA